jgi:phosphoserine aminotransferase
MMHNFNAGPSILPREVFKQASEAILDYNNSGLSILEIGHRTDLFQAVMDEAIYLLNDNEIAAYTDTGTWSAKAIKEAKLYGHVEVVCSAKESNYNHLPKQFTVPKTAKYLHLTTNETIHGVQWHDFTPFFEAGVPLVADMSSDILSRVMDFNKFDLIYAGAQKNVGAAGVNLVIINKNILGKVNRKLATMMDYRNHIENGSMLNTPPVFAVYVCMLTLRWLKQQGGVAKLEKLNAQKATLLYDTIDNLPIFKGKVAKEDRSTMNVCFVMDNAELEKEFLTLCKQNSIVGIKGHRTVGGFRASLYNALPMESVQVLTAIMQNFANKKG